jgi:hypothetical protein
MRRVLFWALAMLNCGLWAQTPNSGPASAASLAEISARGRALAEYDAAAWHATDAVTALKPAAESLERYVARNSSSGWVVVWGYFNQDRTKFLIVYEARQRLNSDEYEVAKHDPPLEDSDFYVRAARAHELAMTEFFTDLKPQRPYNISILPAPAGSWYVYALPAQTDLAVLPFGGDVRYTVAPDGTKITEKRPMHKIVLEENIGKVAFGFHTHVLSDVPEDSDVFYALTRKAAQGEWIGSRKYIYELSPLGSLRYLGETEAVLKLLEEGKYPGVPEAYRPMLLASERRLLEALTHGEPLEAFASFVGATCADNTIWLKFAETLHNIGEQKIVLHKSALENSQVRFAASEAEIAAGTYEKLVFFAPANSDYTDERAFTVLSPGMSYRQEREYPILGLDLNGKAAVQFLFFTWPLGKDQDAGSQRARWSSTGFLYTEAIATKATPLIIAPELLHDCRKK